MSGVGNAISYEAGLLALSAMSIASRTEGISRIKNHSKALVRRRGPPPLTIDLENTMNMSDGKEVLSSGTTLFSGLAVIAGESIPTITVRTLFVEGDAPSVLTSSEVGGIGLVGNLPESTGQHGIATFTLPGDRPFRVLWALQRFNNLAHSALYQFDYTITRG